MPDGTILAMTSCRKKQKAKSVMKAVKPQILRRKLDDGLTRALFHVEIGNLKKPDPVRWVNSILARVSPWAS